MKLGFFGLPSSGRKTVYNAICAGLSADDDSAKKRKAARMEIIKTPDPRLYILSDIFKPKKTTPARLTFLLPDDAGAPVNILAELSGCDGLVFVVRNFTGLTGDEPDPATDLASLEEELILRDLAIVENRMERINKGKSKGVETQPGEEEALARILEILNDSKPIRTDPEVATHPSIRQYSFLSAKPRLIVVNNAEGDNNQPDLGSYGSDVLVLQGQIEMELTSMDEEEAAEFRSEYGLTEPGLELMVSACYKMLDIISFFTVGEDEVRAWTVKRDAKATKAAGAIHSDLEKGFIRAEVISYEDFISSGNMNEAKKKGLLRLEGKEYLVQDGDIMNIRFNV